MSRMKWFVLFAGVLAGIVTSGAAGAAFTAMYVFGDSSSDTGRRLQLQGTKPASPPFYQGRHSNGPVAVEYLADALGLTAPGQFVNYAVGGALSGHGNVDADPSLAQTGLLDQLGTFKSGYAAADPSALYFIYGGDNDINACRTGSPCTSGEINAVVTNLTTLVQGLSDYGAHHFMVIGSAGGGADKASFRSELRNAMQNLDSTLASEITYFSARPVLLQMLAADNPYGFTETSPANPCHTGSLQGGGTQCGNPDAYVFWDPNGHLTARANQIMGEAMIGAAPVPEPKVYAMMLAALGMLGLIACRRKTQRAGFD